MLTVEKTQKEERVRAHWGYLWKDICRIKCCMSIWNQVMTAQKTSKESKKNIKMTPKIQDICDVKTWNISWGNRSSTCRVYQRTLLLRHEITQHQGTTRVSLTTGWRCNVGRKPGRKLSSIHLTEIQYFYRTFSVRKGQLVLGVRRGWKSRNSCEFTSVCCFSRQLNPLSLVFMKS